jgi:hypothetical protein
MDIFKHFCDVFVAYYIIVIQFFIKKHLALHYIVFCSKNYTKTCVGQYFLHTQVNQIHILSSSFLLYFPCINFFTSFSNLFATMAWSTSTCFLENVIPFYLRYEINPFLACVLEIYALTIPL